MNPLQLMAGIILATIVLTGCPENNPEEVADDDGLIDPHDQQAVLYYKRADGDYDDWGLHLWNTEACNGLARSTDWSQPKLADGVDPEHGAYYRIALTAHAQCINFTIHKGDESDLGGVNQMWSFDEYGRRLFTVSGYNHLSSTPFDEPPIRIVGASAHWLDSQTLVWYDNTPTNVELVYSRNAGIELDSDNNKVTGGKSVPLTPATLSDDLKARFPHLADSAAFTVPIDPQTREEALKGQVVAVARNSAGEIMDATEVQTPGVLDDLYAYDDDLGVIFTGNGPLFRLWAPTAQKVRLHAFDANRKLLPGFPKSMAEVKGVWRYQGNHSLDRAYYQYEVTVYHPLTRQVETLMTTDPYAVSLSRNSQYAQVVNLTDTDLKPAGWNDQSTPTVANPEDIVIYESHVRDFSAHDETVSQELRGKYLAFTETGSDGMRHLSDLTEAGITHLHLLPTFDIATVSEDTAATVDINDSFQVLCNASETAAEQWSEYCGSQTIRSVLQSLDPATGDAQALYDTLRGKDSFNWGYDPWHYTVPEGSYATDAEGSNRILEFRRLVQSLNELGLNVVMDVVYNHTNASGVSDKSVLDRIVPGYYHRRDPATGNVEQSSCCENTASEHAMMQKLMIDSLVTWAQHYRISGFRFDLMGHHMRHNMTQALEAVRAVDPDTYFYGEAWNFGEVKDNARGTNAIQPNMGGTGIGSFNDRARDAVRGGGPFDGGQALRQRQGFGNGLYVQPNELNIGSDAEKARLLERADWIRSGIAGGLADYVFETADGTVKAARNVDYHDQRTGYTADPQELVNYVSKHDNQTLWDNNQYKVTSSATLTTRARMQIVSLSVPTLSQGIPFLHMGSEILRSKSMQRDSYDSGDWFNEIDFSLTSTTWNRGLPRETKDGGNWNLIKQIIQDSNARPDTSSMLAAKSQFEDLLKVRRSSPLFRLTSAAAVQARLQFHNTGPSQIPGVIAYSIDDSTHAGDDLDPQRDSVMVIMNATPQVQTLDSDLSGFRLHPSQQTGDATTARASFNSGQFAVPAWTTAVFEQPQIGGQGEGVPVSNVMTLVGDAADEDRTRH
ncbi:pullulanase-type alpha-1,6-glucosidase [Marinobacter lacisalsi]|uniref:pullulanase n=1 Tax=Marinobacter lacisalsi TaxID=475979 RepID=A0ABV8QKR7_9GAMM